jgi:hypothetical protein
LGLDSSHLVFLSLHVSQAYTRISLAPEDIYSGVCYHSGNKVAWLFGPRRRALVLGRGREKVVDGQQAVVIDMLWRRRATATWRLVERTLAHCAWSRGRRAGWPTEASYLRVWKVTEIVKTANARVEDVEWRGEGGRR